ncbi:MAG: fibronectin type III domain-containing protein, partial [Bacillota bacterium]|nr:fibronectin type III domain-containing protein [Bacillota bacterium]
MINGLINKIISIILVLALSSTSFVTSVNTSIKTNEKTKKIYLPFKRNKVIDNTKVKINISAKATDKSITIYWDSVDGVKNYDIEVDGEIIDNGLNNSYLHSDLKPGTEHTYRIRVNNWGKSGNWSEPLKVVTKEALPEVDNTLKNSLNRAVENKNKDSTNITRIREHSSDNTIKITIPGIPTKISAVSTSNSIIVIWNPVSGATGYDIEFDGVVKECGDKFTFVYSELLPGTIHNYRIRSKNSAGNSPWSDYFKQSTLQEPIATPENVIGTVNNNSITLTWDGVKGATGYEVEVDGKVKDNGIATSYIDASLTIGTTHAYRVRAKKNNDSGSWSQIIVKSIMSNSTDANTKKADDVNTTKDKSDSKENKTNTKIKKEESSNVNTQDSNLNYSNTDASSETISTELPTAPANLTASSVSCNTLDLRWTASTSSSGIAGYDIYNGTTKIASTSGDTNYTVTGLNPNTSYSFTVTARDASGNVSKTSSMLEISTTADTEVPTAPTNLAAASITSSTLNLTWTASRDNVAVAGYDIYNGTTKIGSTSESITNYAVVGLTPNTTYSFVIVARDAAGNVSSASETINATTLLSSIVNISTASTNNSIGILWNAMQGTIGYDVEVDGNIVDNGASTYYINSGLVSGSQHSYRVRAKNGLNVGEWSTIVTSTAKSSTTSINSNTALNSDAIYGDLVITSGTYDLNKHTVVVLGSLAQSAGTLYVDGGSLIITRDYNIVDGIYGSCGILRMINDKDYICVGGNFLTKSYCSTASNLSAGVLEIKGNFTQKLYGYGDNFAASGTHKVVLSGSGVQTVGFDNPGSSGFSILQTNNINGGISFNTVVSVNTLIGGGIINSSLTLINIKTPLTDDYTINGDLNLQSGTLDLGGRNVTVTGNLNESNGTINLSSGRLVVLGSVTQSKGTLYVNNGSLIISGDYKITDGTYGNYPILLMTNDEDYISVGRNFLIKTYASGSSYITAGVLEVKGDFIEQGGYNGCYSTAYNNFTPGGTNKVILSGSGVQTVSFAVPDKSYFNILQINNIGGSVVFNTGVIVNKLVGGGVINSALKLINLLTPLSDDLTINGDLNILGGAFDLGGNYVDVTGNVNLSSGTIALSCGELDVKGDVIVSGGTINLSKGILDDFGAILQTAGIIDLGEGSLYVDKNMIQTGGTAYIEYGDLYILGDYILE